MSYEPPEPPTDLPAELVTSLDECSPARLRQIASYAAGLAEYKEREDRLDEESSEAETDDQRDELPDDVPAKATITTKEINDNRYYYWQWREGDAIKSKYKGPVDSGDQ